ncbi:MAG: hypothetical protein K940chlam3_01293 [Chlamydiae bacterium]|nr:hypothetical protein [Chlamydiota bacterium]
MMAGLFVIFLFSILLIWLKWNNTAIVVVLFNLILCALMLCYHATSILNIRL